MNEKEINNLMGPHLMDAIQIAEYKKTCILICKLTRFKYEELLKNGFNENQALELSKQL